MNKVMTVTGGGRGIGTATAKLAAERVNAVRGGFILTDIHASGGEPNRVERVKEFVPIKRGETQATRGNRSQAQALVSVYGRASPARRSCAGSYSAPLCRARARFG